MRQKRRPARQRRPARRTGSVAAMILPPRPGMPVFDDLFPAGAPMTKVRVILCGHDVTPQQLEAIRAEIEGFDWIEVAAADMRELLARKWPHLLPRLRPHPRISQITSDLKLLSRLWAGLRKVNKTLERSRAAVHESMALLALADAMAESMISPAPLIRRTNEEE